jgi:hypothetical protein
MGVALALKPVAQKRFSVLAFGFAQVAMDIEPLVGMLRDQGVLHGWTHTVLGAGVIGTAVALAAPPVLGPMVRWLHRKAGENRLAWILDREAPTRLAVWAGALVGSFSHVALDALIHHDMRPFAPLSQAAPLLGLVDHDDVYLACAALAFAGSAAWWLMRRPRKPGRPAPRRDN